MNRRKPVEPPKTLPKMRPALTPEAREGQLIALATDLVEQRLRDGTATSQEVVHFLRLGSMRERLEREKLENENILLGAGVAGPYRRAVRRCDSGHAAVSRRGRGRL